MAEHLLTNELNIHLVCLVVYLFQLDEEHGGGETLGREGGGHDEALGLAEGQCRPLDEDVAVGRGRGDGARAGLEGADRHLAHGVVVSAREAHVVTVRLTFLLLEF